MGISLGTSSRLYRRKSQVPFIIYKNCVRECGTNSSAVTGSGTG